MITKIQDRNFLFLLRRTLKAKKSFTKNTINTIVILMVCFFFNQLKAQTNYYSKSTATDFTSVSSWGTNTDGTGTSPASISNADNFIIANNAVMTLPANAAVRQLTINTGSLTVSANTLTVAIASQNNSSLTINSGGTLAVSGSGIVNLNGNLVQATGGTLSQSGGNINIDGNNAGIAATSVASGTALVNLNISIASNLALTGGTFTIVDPHAATTASNAFTVSTGLTSISTGVAHTLKFGDGVSTDPGGNVIGFLYNPWLTTGLLTVGNVIIDGPGGVNRVVTLATTYAPLLVAGNLTINSGGELLQTNTTAASGLVAFAGNVTNNGTMTLAGTAYLGNAVSASATTTTLTATSQAQVISGSGVFRNSAAATSASFATFTINNSNATGVTFNSPAALSFSGAFTNTLGTVNYNNATSVAFQSTYTNTAGNVSFSPNVAIVGSCTVTAGSLSIGSGSTLTVNAGTTLSVADAIRGAGNFVSAIASSLTIAGSGAAIQAGLTGATIRNAGTITINTGTITLNGGTGQSTGTSFPTSFAFGTVALNSTGGTTITQNTSFFNLSSSTVINIPTGITATTVFGGALTMANAAGAITVAGTLQVNGTVTLGSTATVTGTGTFNLGAGATMSTASAAGINLSGATGSIQTSGRTFDAGAHYTFTGTSLTTGTGLPTIVNGNVLFNGTTAQTLSQSTTFNGNVGGSLSITLGASVTMTIGSTSTFTLNGVNLLGTTGTLITNSGATLSLTTTSTTNGYVPTAAAGSGNIQVNVVSFDPNTNFTLNSATAGIVTGARFPAFIGRLIINSTGSGTVVLGAALSASSLTMSGTNAAGGLTTTTANILTVTGTIQTAVIRTGSNFVNGPMIRVLPASLTSGTAFLYPIGKTAYQGFELLNATTNASGTVNVQVESFATAPTGGTAGTGLTGSLAAQYWQVSAATGSGTLTGLGNIRVTQATAWTATQKLGLSATLGGAYNSIGGTLGGTTLNSSASLSAATISAGVFIGAATTSGLSSGFTAGVYAIGPGTYTGFAGTYTSLGAALGAIGDYSSLTGAVVLELQTDYVSTVEFYPLVLGSGLPTTLTNNITIRPNALVSSTINFSYDGTAYGTSGVFDFNGAKFVKIDGRPGGTGTNQRIAITNLGTGPAVRFINEAQNDTIRRVLLTSNNILPTSGVVFFSTAIASGTGNNSNGIDFCNINGNGVNPYGILSSGSTASANEQNRLTAITNNNIYDFFRDSSTAVGGNVGVLLNTGSTSFTVSGNSIYQTSDRTFTVNFTTHRGILISNTANNAGNFVITNNFIGGSAPSCGGSPWRILGTGANAFYGIQASQTTNTGNTSSIQGNTIQNIRLDLNSATANTIMFGGIVCTTSGDFNVGTTAGNIIGSGTGTGSITINANASANSIAIEGIDMRGVISNVQNNIIGSFTVGGTSNSATTFSGIVLTSTVTGTASITGNTIGSGTATFGSGTANSIQFTSAIMPVAFTAISNGATPAISISNNIIANITSVSNQISSVVRGILHSNTTSTGIGTITGNVIRDMSSATSLSYADNSLIQTAGIYVNATSATGHIVSNNQVHSLINTNATTATGVIGIFYNGTSGYNLISRNSIHSLGVAFAGGSLRGIYNFNGAATLQNNMVRLGINRDGTDQSLSLDIQAFRITSTSSVNYLNNTVYVGGTGVSSGALNTYAYNRIGVNTTVDSIMNNIFVNERSNSGATGINYAVVFPGSRTSSTIISNYNIYRATGTGAALISLNSGVSGVSLMQYQQSISTLTDLNSGESTGSDNVLTSAKTGRADGTLPNVSLAIANPSAASNTGVVVSAMTEDFYGTANRSGINGQLTNIGASNTASSITAAGDIFAPVITYTPSANKVSTDVTFTNIVITDANSGIPTIGSGNGPRFYYRNLSTSSTWASVPATSVSTNNYTFNINYSSLSPAGVVAGNVIQYYVVAQDLATSVNVRSNPIAGFTGTGVNSVTTPPTTPNSYTIATGFPTSVNVGVGEVYTSLTGTGGVFDGINNSVLSANSTITITSDLNETGLNQLNAGALNGYTLSIVTNTATVKRIVNSGNLTNSMIRVNGVNGLIIDGRVAGAGQYLRFTNTNATQGSGTATLAIDGAGASNMTIRNCIFENNTTSASYGTVLIGSGTNAISNITFLQNIFRDTVGSLAAASAATHMRIASSGATRIFIGSSNASDSNSFINFNGNAVIATSVGDSVIIRNNSFYQTFTRSVSLLSVSIAAGNAHNVSNNYFFHLGTTLSGAYGAITIGGSGNAHTINNNSIGGSAYDRSGTPIATTVGSTSIMINITAGTGIASNIQGNRFSNFANLNASSGVVVGLQVNGGNVNVGTTSSNIFGGGQNAWDTIQNSYDNGMIWVAAGNTVNVSNNIVGNVNYWRNAGDRNCGILVAGGTTVNVTGNTIRDMKGNNTGTGISVYSNYGIGISGGTTVNVDSNFIYNITNVNTGASAYKSGAISVNAITSATYNITRNRIYGINGLGTGTGTSSNLLTGIYILGATSGTLNIRNNQISIVPSASVEAQIRGIEFNTGTPSALNIQYNSVLIGGTSTGNTNSYGFLRSVTGITTDVRNNIFYNNRTGLGNHFAIGSSSATVASFTNTNNLFVDSLPTNAIAEIPSGTTRSLAAWNTNSNGSANLADSSKVLTQAVLFTGAGLGNLSTAHCKVSNMGVAISGFTTDYNGATRNATTPDIGSVEFTSATGAPAITTQPATIPVACAGSSVNTLNVTATGTGLTYTWQVNTGSGWMNIGSDTAVYTGTGTSGLTLTNPGAAYNGNQYRVFVSGSCASADTSVARTLTVNGLVANNTISSSPQTICSGSTPTSITATLPTGGDGTTYTYQWLSSTTSATAGFSAIASSNTQNYTPGALTTSTWYRRKVSSGTCAADTTAALAVTVNAVIAGNTIASSQSILSGATPTGLTGALPTGGNSTYTYTWLVSTTSATAGFSAIASSNTQNYSPGALTANTWYRRLVVSGSCSDTSSALAITITSAIANNTISGASTICSGSTPTGLTGTLPTGGSSSYTYTWLSSTTSGTTGFSAIASSNTQNYSPGALTVSTWYRRYVVSGAATDTSVAVKVTVNVAIATNTISSSPQTVCSGSTPASLTASTPTGGDGTAYTYQWLSSTTSATAGFSAIASTNTQNYAPGALTASTWYRRRVTSGVCAADTTAAVAVTVNAVIAGNTIASNQSIVSGTAPAGLTGALPTGGNSTYTYTWLVSTTSATAGFSAIASSNTQNYNPGTLTANTWYRRLVVSGSCSDTSSAVAISVTSAIANNTISGASTICSGSTPTGLTGTLPTGGSSSYTYTWLSSTTSGTTGFSAIASSNTQNYSPGSLTQTTWYRRYVVSGAASDTSTAVTVTVNTPGVWGGTVSTAWNNTANWTCPQIPTSTTNVTIGTATNMPTITDIQQCNNLTINSGATLTLTGATAQLNLYGTFTNNGTFTNTSTGKTVFMGSSQQTVPAGNYTKLQVNNAAGVVLGGAVTLSDSLLLTNGTITLGANNLTLGAGSYASAGSASSYIKTNGAGAVIVNGVGSTGKTGNVIIPVGNTTYNPAVLLNTGTTDNYTVRLFDSVTTNYSGSAATGAKLTSNALNRTWIINEGTAGGSNATVTLQWNTADELSGFSHTACYVARYNGTVWMSTTATAATGSNPYTQTRSGITSFSPFSVGSGGTLPVELIVFAGTRKSEKAYLRWTTASEINNDYFIIERSLDNKIFEPIGQRIKGNGNSNNVNQYEGVDADAMNYALANNSSTVYYRLRQVDFDGSVNYSKLISVLFDNEFIVFNATISPNPFDGSVQLNILTNNESPAQIEIIDIKGLVVYSEKLNFLQGNSNYVLNNLDQLAEGMYFIKVKQGIDIKVIKANRINSVK